MSLPIIGFAGMTHLGLVSGVAASEKGFRVICFDEDRALINDINKGKLLVSEPGLDELIVKNKERIVFTSNLGDLSRCAMIYIAPDIPTDHLGGSDLNPISFLLNKVMSVANAKTVLVILSQVPPGFTRSKLQQNRDLYYQVETLIFGKAVQRALVPERFIVGCDDPSKSLPKVYLDFLAAYECPILPMRFESAELAKISINMCLVASICVANTMAELCEKLGADWSEIIPALKLDKRIGEFSYLSPGLGISGGNLERDLATVCKFSDQYDTDSGVVRAWISNSIHRKQWPVVRLKQLLDLTPNKSVVAIWGLAYKEDTHSTKNSPSLVAISMLQDMRLRVFDPVVKWSSKWHGDAIVCDSAISAIEGADALLILTPWHEFRSIDLALIAQKMNGSIVIDPYNVLGLSDTRNARLEISTLGV